MRDFREDVADGQLFWPRELWAKEYGLQDLKDMYKPENEKRELWALSAMTLDAIRHAIGSLDYLTLLKTWTVINFYAIPQTMAMATLALCFTNSQVFHRNVKIRKTEATRVSAYPYSLSRMFADENNIHSSSSCARQIREM